MNILLGYGFSIGTTGFYIERALSKVHGVTYVGTSVYERPGYPPSLSLDKLAKQCGQIDAFIYLDNGNTPYAPRGMEKLDCPTVAYLVDAWPPNIGVRNPYLETYCQFFDHVFVAHIGAVERYKKLRGGAPTMWLPAACDAEIHFDQRLTRQYDVGFVGSINKERYPERIAVLDALSKRYRMNDYTRPYFLEEMSRVYSLSRIVVNISHSKHILPLRVFEAPAAGSMLITSKSETNGQNTLMKEGEEFISFENLSDLMAKIDYYLSHEEERERIARNGQSAVLARHTYDQRVATLIEMITDTPYSAPARSWPDRVCDAKYAEVHSKLQLIDAVMDNTSVAITRRLWLSGLAMLRRIKHRQ